MAKRRYSKAFRDQQKIMKEASKLYNAPSNIKGTKSEPVHVKSWQRCLNDVRAYYADAHNFGAAGGRAKTTAAKTNRSASRSVVGTGL